MLTWRDGRLAGLDQLLRRQMPLRSLIALVTEEGLNRVPGTAVYLDSSPSGVPRALQRTIETHKTIHERMVLLTVETGDEPRSRKGERVTVRELAPGLFRVVARYGFMESRSVPSLLAEAEKAARLHDLGWERGPLELKPSKKLGDLIRQSRHLRQGGQADE